MAKLTDSIKIGEVEIKNRLFAAPFVGNWGNYWGGVTDTVLETYENRAKGGYGLVAIEATTIDSRTNNFAHMLELTHFKHACDFNKIVQVIHRWGAKAVVQLQHGGSRSNPQMCDEAVWGDTTPLAPSAETPPYPGRPPLREITLDEIEEVLSKYVTSVTIAKTAGLDGVLFHFTHGFLPHQFMSPWTNRRTDKWGVQDGKYLFCTEIIRRCREAVGPNFMLGARIPGEDNLDTVAAMVNPAAGEAKNYLTLEMMAKQIAPQLVEAGLDYLDVTTGQLEAIHHVIPMLYMPRGYFIKYAEEIKKNVKVPVVGGAKVCDPLLAARAVEDGRVDAVFVARPMLADPDYPRKFFGGRKEEIRQCISCDYCTVQLFSQYEVKCAVNPDIGPIKFPLIKKVSNPKKVLVVGGGVGGMEAARLADLSGHKVTLCESRNELGGMVKAVSSLPRLYTRDLANIINWQKHQLSKSSVKVELNKKVTLATVKKIDPDSVILATGAHFDVSELKGCDQSIVTTLDAYLKGDMQAGERVVVIGGAIGAEPALSLAREGKEVTILEEGPHVGALEGIAFTSGIGSGPWMYLYRTLWMINELGAEKKANIFSEVKIKEITKSGVNFTDNEGKDQSIDADTVIIATNHKPNTELRESLSDIVSEIYEVGDCIKPGQIKDAIHSAHHVVRSQLNEEL